MTYTYTKSYRRHQLGWQQVHRDVIDDIAWLRCNVLSDSWSYSHRSTDTLYMREYIFVNLEDYTAFVLSRC